MKSKATITGAALALLLIGTLVGCAESPGDGGSDTTEEPAAVEESDTDWTEVEEFVPTLLDGIEGIALFRMLWAGDQPQEEDEWSLQYEYFLQDEPDGPAKLVLGKDGVIDLRFLFQGAEVSRNITAAYVTDSPDSTEEKAVLTCDPTANATPQHFICFARFSVPGDPGGTYYGVIETEPAYPEEEAYGSKRAVESIAVEPFGSEGSACEEIEGEMKCNSRPKE